MIKFEDLPSKSTPLNAANLNTNFDELKKLATYSSDESVIGTWIDGRPVYRRTFVGQTTSANDMDITREYSAANIELIRGYGNIGGYGGQATLGSNIIPEWNSGLFINYASIGIYYGNNCKNKKYIITLEFVKR